MYSKFFCGLLVFVMALQIYMPVVFANTYVTVCPEIQLILERDKQLAICPVNNVLIAQREAEFQEFIREDRLRRMRNARMIVSNSIAVPVFQQERSYWCGPATARQVIHFRNGSAPSQAVLANELGTHSGGTDVHSIAGVVNRHTGTRYAAGFLPADQTSWVDEIRFSIFRRQPVVMTIDTTRVAAFPYNSSGHIVNVSGYQLSEVWHSPTTPAWSGAIRITDPFGPGLGNRWYSVNDLFNAHITNRTAPFRGRAVW